MSTKSKGSPHLSVTVIKISLCYDIDPYFASQKKKKKDPYFIQNKFTRNSGNKNKSMIMSYRMLEWLFRQSWLLTYHCLAPLFTTSPIIFEWLKETISPLYSPSVHYIPHQFTVYLPLIITKKNEYSSQSSKRIFGSIKLEILLTLGWFSCFFMSNVIHEILCSSFLIKNFMPHLRDFSPLLNCSRISSCRLCMPWKRNEADMVSFL